MIESSYRYPGAPVSAECRDARIQGREAGLLGKPILSNPHPQDSPEFRHWVDGWVEGVRP